MCVESIIRYAHLVLQSIWQHSSYVQRSFWRLWYTVSDINPIHIACQQHLLSLRELGSFTSANAEASSNVDLASTHSSLVTSLSMPSLVKNAPKSLTSVVISRPPLVLHADFNALSTYEKSCNQVFCKTRLVKDAMTKRSTYSSALERFEKLLCLRSVLSIAIHKYFEVSVVRLLRNEGI